MRIDLVSLGLLITMKSVFAVVELTVFLIQFMLVDCKINPNAVRTKKISFLLKWCLPQTHLLGADLLSSITYSERIKIETFCALGLSNIQMGVRINFTIYHK
ncbi:hypothetical protein BG617_15570 [Lactiplantibacillus paraplantarum]|nr:hypothetical protein BG617_15570 [Lactiplantibacillus paraplantarum]